jgi:malate permease and related proteins
MDVFETLFLRLIPLYIIVGLGFFAGRRLGVDRDSVAKLVIYLVSPVVVFTNVSQIELKPEYLAVPLGFAILCSLIAACFLTVGRKFGSRFGVNGPSVNLLAFAAGNSNTGYFGLPIALMLFGPSKIGIYLLFCLGFLIYENTVGFYILARGSATMREAIVKLIKLPILYAFLGAFVAKAMGMRIEGTAADFSNYFRGAYSVLGVMLIGLGVAEVRTFRFDWRFTLATFFGKFGIWPFVVGIFIVLDQKVFGIYSIESRQMMLLIACCPLAANTVAYATLLKTEPEKAGVAVLLSTVFALFFIPAAVAVLF